MEARSAGEGRGLGLFTTRPISAYTEILSDPPAILLKPSDDLPQLYEQFVALPQNHQDKFLTLAYHDQLDKDVILKQKLRARGVPAHEVDLQVQVGHTFQTNAFTVDVGGDNETQTERQYRTLFLNVARMNHSCAPNAHVCFYPATENQPRGRMVVHTLHDLEAGEEVLISYFSIILPRAERQAKAEKWGFTCMCTVCDKATPGQAKSEKRRKTLVDFKAEQAAIIADPRPSIKSLAALINKGTKQAAETYNEPALRPTLPDMYDQLGMLEAKVLIVQGRENERVEVLKWLEKAVIQDAYMTGLGSPATKRRVQKLEQFANRKGETKRASVDRDEVGKVIVCWEGE